MKAQPSSTLRTSPHCVFVCQLCGKSHNPADKTHANDFVIMPDVHGRGLALCADCIMAMAKNLADMGHRTPGPSF